MALKNFDPVTPGRRSLVLVNRSELWKGKPEKGLTEGLSSKGGRNNKGRSTVAGTSNLRRLKSITR